LNWILIVPEDQTGESAFSLRNERHSHIQSILKKGIGDSIKLILLNQGHFLGRIDFQNQSETVIKLESSISYPDFTPNITTVCILPRPQTGKKILHLAGCYGVDSLFWIPDGKSKEYLTSPVYNQNESFRYLYEGMMQSGNFRLPKIEIERRTDWLSKFSDSGNLFAMDRNGENIRTRNFLSEEKHIFLFGPESGWKEKDYESFKERNIPLISLSKVNLRTEYAYSTLLHEVLILKTESARN
jgi:RsmE family RNA methyltransferase